MGVLWRDTGIYPRIGFIDARAIFPIFLFLFHWAYWTFFLAMFGIFVLTLVQRAGLTPIVALRTLKIFIFVGKRRETRLYVSVIRKRCR